MVRLCHLALICCMLAAITCNAHAANSGNGQPNLMSFEVGYFNFDKMVRNKRALDMRLEHRWGVSLLPLINPYFKNWDSTIQLHPFLGMELISRGSLYGLGGLAMDWHISDHWIFTWSEGVGAYYRGNGPRMGSVLQFRSQIELGRRFDNNMRATLELSHISDAEITRLNPGAEIIGLYVHVPTALIFSER